MKSIYAVAIGTLIIFGLSLCQRKDCQAPPPQYDFAFITAQQKPIVTDSLQAISLRLVYYSSAGTKTIVPITNFKPYPSNGPSKYVYRVGYDLISQNQPTEYTVELGGQAINKLSLTTQKNNSDCDGWMHLIDVRSNQKPVSIDPDNITYLIKVDL